MSSVQAPGERPGIWQTVGDAIRRIRALEAIPPGVLEITSVDNSIVVVDPTGPVTDLSVAGAGIRFDFDNQGGYLDVQTNNVDGDNYGIHFNDDTPGLGSLYEAEQSVLIRRQDGTSSILVGDGFSGITIHTAAQLLLDVATLAVAAGALIDGGGNVATNFADGIAGTDLATVEQITGAVADAILFAVANSGTFLDIQTTNEDGTGYGIKIEDTASTNGILITSAADVTLESPVSGSATLSGANGVTIQSALGGVTVQIAPGQTFTLLDSSASPMLQMTEGSPDLHIPVSGTVVADL